MPHSFIADLVQCGLSEIEAKAYIALLDHYKLSAKELSQITGIFRTQTYDVLKNLISKGFCTEVFDKVKMYVPVDPELALDTMTNELERRARLGRSLSRQLHQMFIVNENNNHNDSRMIEVLRSPSAVRKRLRAYLKDTQKVILSFNKPPYQLRLNGDKGDLITCSRNELLQVSHRAIFQIDNRDPLHSYKVAKTFQEHGEDVRIARFLPMKMMIFDNNRVFYQLAADQAYSEADIATFIHHPEISLTLINSFWVEWDRSFTLDDFEKELNL
jgi:sugar-specific transcriptional regulator TrmB